MRILLIDDEPMVLKSLSSFLSNQLEHDITACDQVEAALEAFRREPFPLVISDIRMPGLSGLDLLKEFRQIPGGELSDIVLMTGHASLDTAIAALRAGAYDFLTKPVNIELLASAVERALEHQQLMRENRHLQDNFEESLHTECLFVESKLKKLQHAYAEAVGIGRIGIFSPALQNIVELCEKLHQDRNIPVLIRGETGTGKDVIARLIHYGREGTDRPFVTLNCSAISPSLFESELFGYEAGAFTGAARQGSIGKLELAQGGTLFLDEIGDLPAEMQPKLLKALQDKEIYRVGGIRRIRLDVRVIFATNRDLEKYILAGKFREDLYYRINTMDLTIPPLRERKEDILPLAQLFLQQFAEQHGTSPKMFSRESAEFLTGYSWPGNVRQLRNAVERVCFLSDLLEIKQEYFSFLDENAAAASQNRNLSLEFPEQGRNLYELQEKIVRHALKLNRGNKTATARYLQISLNKLKRILKEM